MEPMHGVRAVMLASLSSVRVLASLRFLFYSVRVLASLRCLFHFSHAATRSIFGISVAIFPFQPLLQKLVQ